MDQFLFLDIDGVLNSETFLKRLEAGYDAADPQAKLIWFAWKNQIDRAAVTLLNEIVHAVPDLKIVLASSWRLFVDLDTIQDLLTSFGFIGRLYGETPDLSEDRVLRQMRANNQITRITRGHEISRWLEQTLDVTSHRLQELLRADRIRIVILDDAEDMVHLRPWMVTTDAQVGLHPSHVRQVIQAFSAGWPH